MKIIRALYYQYYWWQMRMEKNDFFAPILAVFSILCPLFGIIGFIAIFADVVELIDLQKYDAKMVFYGMFILGLFTLLWLFLSKKRYKTIVQEHKVYDTSTYRRLAVIYPILSAIIFFIGLYIGYLHNMTIENQ